MDVRPPDGSTDLARLQHGGNRVSLSQGRRACTSVATTRQVAEGSTWGGGLAGGVVVPHLAPPVQATAWALTAAVSASKSARRRRRRRCLQLGGSQRSSVPPWRVRLHIGAPVNSCHSGATYQRHVYKRPALRSLRPTAHGKRPQGYIHCRA